MLLLSGDVELQALYKEGGASHAVPGCANQGAKVIGLPGNMLPGAAGGVRVFSTPCLGTGSQLAAVSLGGWMGGNLV